MRLSRSVPASIGSGLLDESASSTSPLWLAVSIVAPLIAILVVTLVLITVCLKRKLFVLSAGARDQRDTRSPCHGKISKSCWSRSSRLNSCLGVLDYHLRWDQVDRSAGD